MTRARAQSEARAGAVISVPELARMLDQHAAALAPELLPNGRQEGNFWRTSNVSDVPTGNYSLAVNLNGPRVGMWTDFGAAIGAQDRSGDMLKLVAVTRFGGDIGLACQFARSWLGLDGLDPGRIATRRAEVSRLQKQADEEAARKAEKMRRLALALYLDPRGVPIVGSPAEDYLANRGIDLSLLPLRPSRALKFHPAVWNRETGRELPAMIAAVIDMEGRHVATHRTWLAHDGRRGWTKASLENAKMCLGSFQGGYVPLWKGLRRGEAEADGAAYEARPLHRAAGAPWAMSEGIEDGLTAACARPELRTIAAVTLGNMAALAPPPAPPEGEGPGELTIIGQRDRPGSQADRALKEAIRHHQALARAVRLALPPEGVKDANDLARAGAREVAA